MPHSLPPEPSAASDPSQDASATPRPRAWRLLGAACIAIGLINAFIPLLPTTIFLIVGLWAYGKGDPAMRERLMAHPRFGPSLRRWVEHRQISRQGKWAAGIGIALSALLTSTVIGPKPITWAIDAGLIVLIIYLATRPEPPPPAQGLSGNGGGASN